MQKRLTSWAASVETGSDKLEAFLAFDFDQGGGDRSREKFGPSSLTLSVSAKPRPARRRRGGDTCPIAPECGGSLIASLALHPTRA
jgi:hypothetical protein